MRTWVTNAIQCALICVEEILGALDIELPSEDKYSIMDLDKEYRFYEEVKEQLKQM